MDLMTEMQLARDKSMPEDLGKSPDWQAELREGVRTAEQLANSGLISDSEISAYEALLKRYQLLIPPYYLGLIDRQNPDCPIRKQCVPSLMELESRADRSRDPLGDLKHQPVPQLTHRYRNRALLHLTPNCSMYCRHCFRKTLLTQDKMEFTSTSLGPVLQYLQEHTEIEEVIFSGGDPWMIGDAKIGRILRALSEISSIQRIRFHTRVPVTLPMRVTSGLVESLRSARQPLVVVCHFNHPKELTFMAREACSRLQTVCESVLNQSVLLRGVNDNADVLSDLSKGLFSTGVLPYYLHLMDRAEGTEHFDVPKAEAVEIYRKLRLNLPGYLVPRLVEDDGGPSFKKIVGD